MMILLLISLSIRKSVPSTKLMYDIINHQKLETIIVKGILSQFVDCDWSIHMITRGMKEAFCFQSQQSCELNANTTLKLFQAKGALV